VPLYHADTITVGKLHLHFFDTPLDHQDETIHDNALDHTMILSPAMAKRACLTITRGRQRGKEFILAGDRTVIGRASDCDIRISDWTVSKYHAQILRHGDQFVIEDLGSWRAIQVNGLPVKESPLHDSDVIQLGGTRLTFRPVTGEMPAPQPEAPPKRASQIDTQSNDEGYKLAMETAAELAARGEISAPPPAQEVPVPSSSEEPGIDEAFAEGSNCAEADSSPAQLSEGEGGNGSLDTTDPEIAMWLRALKSDRPALRRHAARQLEKLTGQRHEC
jgi:pSer/pThr/pTyr-binding forkhead associated (FHA) protein